MNAIVGVFAFAWLGYFVLLALLPVRYASGEVMDALAMLVTYVAASVACALAVGAGWRTARIGTYKGASPLDERELNQLVVLGLVLSCIGAALIAYVRFAVQGIDYSQGLAVARELWNVEGTQREGISSPLSIPGYGLGFFFFASMFLGHVHWEHLSKRVRLFLIFTSLLLVAAHSILSGGRSVLLLALVSVAAAGAVRVTRRNPAFPGRFWPVVISSTVVIFGAATYFLYIFSERALASGLSSDSYAQSMIAYMGGVPTDGFSRISTWPEAISSATHLIVIAGAYATHSIGTIASVMEYTALPGTATFVSAHDLLVRLGLMPAGDENWVLAGAFLSLPGAFWYDYGLAGVLAVAVFGGAALGGVARFVRQAAGGGVSMGVVASVLMTAMLSPLIMAPDSLAFPFLVLGYAGLSACSFLAFGSRNWWHVGPRCRCHASQVVLQAAPAATALYGNR